MQNSGILARSRKKKALAFFRANKLDEAKALYMQLLAADRMDFDLWLMLGLIQGRQSDYARAADCFRKAISLKPGHIEAFMKLALALKFISNNEEALAVYQKVLSIQPDHSGAGDGLAYLLFEMGRKAEAIEVFRTTLRHHPGKAERHSALGSALMAEGLLEEAVKSFKRALQINPEITIFPALGGALLRQGKIDEALESYREGVSTQPDDAYAYSGMLMALNYVPSMDRDSVSNEHRSWGEMASIASHKVCEYKNPEIQDRRLKVGYISPDFRSNHSVTYFIEPLLAGHTRKEFEVYCYSMMPRPDDKTRRLKSFSDEWRDIYGWGDERLVGQITADGIDILVDLAGHSANNSLTAFACKPAPIQVTYLGYPNTTGLVEMDYRLTDAVVDPPGEDDWYTEKLLRIPGCFLCYQPPADAPPVCQLPAMETGFITFASFNNLAKVNPEVVRLWSKIMSALPESRLIMKNISLSDIATRERYLDMFNASGVSSARIDMHGHISSRTEHLELYNKTDIALDTFPYNGTTTTCEALWMGVPVVSLSGHSHAARVGHGLLGCVGLEEWIADTADDYISVACRHANNLETLSEVRSSLRNVVSASRLCDSKAFVSDVEDIYRWIWQDWCRGR